MKRAAPNVAPAPSRRLHHELVSPVTGEVLDRIPVATNEEIVAAARRLAGPAPPLDLFPVLDRLQAELRSRWSDLVKLTIAETGFVRRDAEDTVNAAIDFVATFETHVRLCPPVEPLIHHTYSSGSERGMLLTSRPFGIVAALVPQNASLALSVTIAVSALHAGARLLLRPSLQCAATGALVAEALDACVPKGHIQVLNCLAQDFVAACAASDEVAVLHYIGSNQYAQDVLARTFEGGKVCLLDGQGNGLLYVDATFPPGEAARLIVDGAIRFNGETCTSVNGVLVDEEIYPELERALVEQFGSIPVGDPETDGTRVGPLFSERQATFLEEQLRESRSGRLLVGGQRSQAFVTPAIVASPGADEPLVREGLFGPAIWIQPVRGDSVWTWIWKNRFPLSDTILSLDPAAIQRFAARSRAARVCVNADPSIESMFEPWGGYPPSGMNPVSLWSDKYRQSYQLDGRLRDITRVGAAASARTGPVER